MSYGISYTHNLTPLWTTKERPKVGSKNKCQIRNQHGLKPLKSHKGTIGSDGYLLTHQRASNDQIYNLDILILEMESR